MSATLQDDVFVMFLLEMAKNLESQECSEDAAHWANIKNAETLRKIAARLNWYDQRITELLTYNNEQVQARRDAEKDKETLKRFITSLQGTTMDNFIATALALGVVVESGRG